MKVCQGDACIGCRKLKPLGDFDEHPLTPGARRSICRACCRDTVKITRAKHYQPARGSVVHDLQFQIGAY